jgi:hypothetical protein
METEHDATHQEPSPTPTAKKHYSQPSLLLYGDVRDLTLAPTPYVEAESGRGAGYRSL